MPRVGYQDGSVDQIEQFGILLSVFCENIPRYMALRFTCIIAGSLHDLDLYLEEPVLPQMYNFIVLHWWKENGFKYPQLSWMACNFLAIPLSVVTHSDAYYTERREANWRLLSFKPELINALKCTRSWKFGYVRSNISCSEAQLNFYETVMRS
ncbi:zinc finger BED domain-containing protein DAYSLEEPER-like [Spinacia oleracea]|uniref:Zinc finger BED domain-containing protein DAYSLEEPER-like n=1 Tax=Spinacia oleracea TaxID=3562 RepID=A0A9R0JM12_SPIOL|nr:zinc finger BED domain-containing protein DAYSLEEPER-like [Spinacia oleracea]XP_021839619.1 zinc finger BED domain-containing protein DAYSLEEPER-like [Spinacia oleracea]XP_021839620.1 zinc finger BED domain-containing protein DAYSLEEPER-like [Spinacia oleracea]XP_021839621.1 zinc finger BED domain-containing protein DAYSLEEPER-like [Spinacia oleracea]XP_056699754.1 zinc finger BED domain-containing protein DAYSLEEPER-like [Spinacia oleracea]XP_056699755.1 zinc finger BED domain-containing p